MNNIKSCRATQCGEVCDEAQCQVSGLCPHIECRMYTAEDVDAPFANCVNLAGHCIMKKNNVPAGRVAAECTRFSWVYPGQYREHLFLDPESDQAIKMTVEPDIRHLYLNPAQIQAERDYEPEQAWEGDYGAETPVERLDQWYKRNIIQLDMISPDREILMPERFALLGTLFGAYLAERARPDHKSDRYFRYYDDNGEMLGFTKPKT